MSPYQVTTSQASCLPVAMHFECFQGALDLLHVPVAATLPHPVPISLALESRPRNPLTKGLALFTTSGRRRAWGALVTQGMDLFVSCLSPGMGHRSVLIMKTVGVCTALGSPCMMFAGSLPWVPPPHWGQAFLSPPHAGGLWPSGLGLGRAE